MSRWFHRSAVPFAAALALAAAGCGDIVLAPPWSAGLSVDPPNRVLDFDEVRVGTKETLLFTITNRGNNQVAFIPVQPPEPPFSWDLELRPGQETVIIEGRGGLVGTPGLRIRFGFSPGRDGERAYRGEARLRPAGSTDDADDLVVKLEGRAIEHPVLCSPPSLDFGRVVVGEQQVKKVSCTNVSAHPVWIEVPAPQRDYGARFVVDRTVEQQDIPAHERLEIAIRFLADGTGGPARAHLPIRIAGTGEPLFPGEGLELLGYAVPSHVVQFGDNAPNPTLDFGFVSLGATGEAFLELRNRYGAPVTLAYDWEPGGDREDFEVIGFPETLGPAPDPIASAGLLRVRFKPRELGPREARLRVRVGRDDPPIYVEDVVLVRGFGGGPVIACDPPWSLDFGPVAVGSTITAALACRNAGADLPTPEDDLELLGVEVGGHLFHPRLVPGEGDDFRVELDYRPVSEGLDLDELVIAGCIGAGCSATPAGGAARTPVLSYRVQLSGSGFHLEPGHACDVALEPPALDLGQVTPGTRARLAVRLVNRGAHECLVNRVDLAPGGSPAFTLAGRSGAAWSLRAGEGRSLGVTLAPGEALPLGIEFDPAAYGALGEGETREALATAGVWVSNPSRPRLELPLRAVAGPSCLELDPPLLDFTALPERAVDPALACGAPDLPATVRNGCAGPRQVTAIVPAAGSDPGFLVSRAEALPRPLAPGEEHAFAVDFRPEAGGVFDGGFRIEVGGGEPLFLPATGRAESGGRWFDSFPLAKPRLDLLLVLSSSAAMAGTPVVTNLSNVGLPGLLTAFTRPDLDWQVGITTTDFEPAGSRACVGGGINGGEAGRLVPATGSSPRILLPGSTFAPDFARNVLSVRACGGAERGFDAAVAAVTPPLSTTAADAHGLGNLGFVRDGAHLAVVFVSAGDDGSARSAADAHAALGAGREAGLFSAWVIAGDVDLGCSFPSGGRASAAYRYLELAHLSNTTIRSVCRTDEWSGLWNAVGNQAIRSQAVYRLDAPAATVLDLALVHLRPDGGRTVVPSWQWTYDAGRRAVVLQRLEVLAALLEQGGSLEVYYRLGCE